MKVEAKKDIVYLVKPGIYKTIKAGRLGNIVHAEGDEIVVDFGKETVITNSDHLIVPRKALDALHAKMMQRLKEDGGDWPIYTGDGE